MRRQLLFLTLALIIGASMSLFDIDRHNYDRGNPAPNHTDALTDGSIKAHGTLSTNYVTDAVSTSNVIHGGFFRIVATGTTNITTGAVNNSVTVTVNHNLGFVPIGMFYMNNSGQFVPLPYTLWGAGTMQLALFVASVDNTSITFQADHTNALFDNTTFPIRYYLLQQVAN